MESRPKGLLFYSLLFITSCFGEVVDGSCFVILYFFVVPFQIPRSSLFVLQDPIQNQIYF